jgi:hypothetical protein
MYGFEYSLDIPKMLLYYLVCIWWRFKRGGEKNITQFNDQIGTG